MTNEGILGTDFLRMHGGKIYFCTNKFFLGGHSTGVLPNGDLMVERLHRPPRGKCVMVGRSPVEGGMRKVAIEMFKPSEEDVLLHKNTHSALVHPVEVNVKEQRAPARGTLEVARMHSFHCGCTT